MYMIKTKQKFWHKAKSDKAKKPFKIKPDHVDMCWALPLDTICKQKITDMTIGQVRNFTL